jgi:hypothetical protein
MKYIESSSGDGTWEETPYFNPYWSGDGDGCSVQTNDGGYCAIPCRHNPNPNTALNVDCDGFWTPCTEACEAASSRTFTMVQERVGGGNECPASADCKPGEDDCPSWIRLEAEKVDPSASYKVTRWNSPNSAHSQCAHNRRASKDECVAALQAAGLAPTATLNVLDPPDPAFPIGCSMAFKEINGAWDPTPIWNPYTGNHLDGGDGCYISDTGGGRCGIPCKDALGAQQQMFNSAAGADAKECASTGLVTLDGDNSANVDRTLCAQRCYVKDECNFYTVVSTRSSQGKGECKGFSTCEATDRVACPGFNCLTRAV